MFHQIPAIAWPILLFVAFLIVVLLVARFGTGTRRAPYRLRNALWSQDERQTLLTVERAAGTGYRVFPKVRLAELLEVPRGAHERSRWQGKINARRLDYVIVDANSFQPWLAIDVVTGKAASDFPDEGTQFIEAALSAAGLPLLKLSPSEALDESYLRGLFVGRRKSAA